ncbi:metallophosphoesterase family protein [Halostella pelagica]|uniref:metallophosphoesterase family protein n=1 Tax=Halostella pelagica TaxID=2583824 RepID=UPI00108167E5|nr:metallophosphoesterase [Halostella pelagica]
MLVLGDAHAADPENREALRSAYDAADADVALHVGDLEYYDLPVPTYFVAGNNEDFDVVESMRQNATLGDRNARLLASTAVEVSGLRVAGLSGNYAPTRYEKSRDELSGDRRRHFTHEDVRSAIELSDVDVFLTHEPPQGFMGRGCAHVDDILRALRPVLCLVGHHHRHAEGRFEDTRLVGLEPVWESYYTMDPETLELERHDTPGSAADG